MTVVVLDVGMEDGLEVASPEDEDAIEALTAQSTDKPLRERICFGSFNGSAEDPQSLGAEDLVEGGYVLGIAIADEEAERARVPACDEVARLLDRPGSVGIGRHARKVDPAGGDLDEHEGKETTKECGVDRNEVARDDAFGLGPQELIPRLSGG